MIKRKQVQLKGYDYSESGYYFVTVCTQNRKEWFGQVQNGIMHLNEFGKFAKDCWIEIPKHFESAYVDESSIMPNHVHGVLIIERNRVGDADMRPNQGDAFMHPLQDKTKMLLPKIIQQYKASVTYKINHLHNNVLFQWQRSFYDHVIRHEKELSRIREYIQNNPLKWDLDRENSLSKNFNLDHDRYWKGIYDSA